MKNASVCWSEGLFFRPHHLQCSDAYWHELIHQHNRIDHPYNFGIYQIELNQELLGTGQLEVTSLMGKLRDGQYVSYQGRLDLAIETSGTTVLEQLRKNEPVIIYLGVPEAKQQNANVSPERQDPTRFLSQHREVNDLCSGNNPQQLEFQSLNLRLLSSVQALTGFDCIPICRLIPSNSPDRVAQLDTTYIPPLLRCNGCPELRQLLRRLSDHFATYFGTWEQELRNRNITFSNYQNENLKGMLFLMTLGEMKAWLDSELSSVGSHPCHLHQTLSVFLGRLAVLNPLSHSALATPPAYDHDNLGSVFETLCQQVEQRLFRPEDSNVIPRFFEGRNGIMKVEIDPAWFEKRDWRLFFGINLDLMPSQDAEHFARKIFFRQKKDKLYWKLGSQDRIEKHFKDVAKGVSISTPEQQKPGLAKRPKWLFCEFEDDRFWQEVKTKYTLCFRIDEDRIHNLPELEGNRKLSVVVDNKIYPIQLSVFAVKN